MTAVAEGVVVTAQNGRIFRLAPGVWNCAQDLLAGVDAAEIAHNRAVDEGAVLALRASLAAADVLQLAVLDQSPREKRWQAKGISALQFTVWYPGAAFLRLQPLWARLTDRGAQVLVTVLSLTGIALGMSSVATSTLPAQISLWDGVLVLLSTLLLTSVHELGHVIALGAHGMAPRRVGIMLFYGSMAMFSDVTPAWSLPRRDQRLQVIGWGMLVTASEAGLCGAAALSTGSTLLQLIFLGLLVTLLVNLVPLARFDGYYLLMLATNSPRLRDLSVGRLRDLLRGRPQVDAGSRPTAGTQLLFGAASIAYGCLLWATVLVQSAVSVLEADGVGLRLSPPPMLPVLVLTAVLVAGWVLLVRFRTGRGATPAAAPAGPPASPSTRPAPVDPAGVTDPEVAS